MADNSRRASAQSGPNRAPTAMDRLA